MILIVCPKYPPNGPTAWPKSSRHDLPCVAAISPTCFPLCGPSLPEIILLAEPKSVTSTLRPKSSRKDFRLVTRPTAKCFPPCGPSLSKKGRCCETQPQRNVPYCLAHAFPNSKLLLGPSPQDMFPTVWPKSPRNVRYCVAQASPK